jgi:hypothetical protein
MLIRGILGFVVFGSLTACVEPVIRRESGETSSSIKTADYEKSDLKKRIWILPFSTAIAWDPAHGDDPELSRALQKQLKDAFADKKGPFLLAQPFGQGIDDFQITSDDPDEELKRVAQRAGADGYLKGTIVNAEVLRTQLPDGLVKTNEFRILLRVNFELYDGFSGRLLFRGQEEEKHSEQRSDLMRAEARYPELDRRLRIMSQKLVQRIYNSVLPASSRMGWTGQVVSVENARVYLNSGERTGLRMGDVLKVIEPYKQIADFNSGRVVGNVPGRIKGTVKIIQFFGDDGSIGVLQSGGGFVPGDMVQLY